MNPFRFFSTLAFLVFYSTINAQSPPANDDPADATELTVQESVCSQSEATAGTFDNLTAALSTRPTYYTGGYGGSGPVKDVWYKFTVPNSKTKVVVQMFDLSPAIAWYTKNDDGSGYTQVGCKRDDLHDEGYLIEELSAGQVIYLQLTTEGHTLGYGAPSGSFAICVWDYEGVGSPANGSLDTATELTVRPSACGEVYVSGTLTKASESTQGAPSCVTGYTESYSDVWYKATVPNSGKLTVEMKAGTPIDIGKYSVMTVYKKSGETYTSVKCSEAYTDNEINYPILELNGRTTNEELYFQVADYNDVRDWQDRYASDFTICAYDPDGTLDLPQTQKPLLSYYSNPVGNRLLVESPYQIQALQVFDLMGKEVLHKTPKQQKLTLDTYALAPGAYLLRVETSEGQQTEKLVKK